MRSTLAALLALTSVVAGCSSDGPLSCDEGRRKAAVLSLAEDYYLYRDLIPTGLSPGDYATAADLLEAVTAQARAEGLEREGWTYLMTETAFDRYFGNAQSVGYGFSLLVEGTSPDQRVFVKQVFAGSAAANAGFARGDEVLAIGPDEASLVNVADATSPSTLASAGGVAGVSKAWRVAPRGGGAVVVRTMASATYDVDPVPSWQIWGTTGYVQLRTFVEPAEAPLRAAFADFKAHGVTDVVVDLRYNGGGSVNTAIVLADLLAQDRVGQPMFSQQFNAAHPELDHAYGFGAEAAGGTFRRVAFLTTGGSASASELVPNVLDPYRAGDTLAYAGARTYGKPLGQEVWTLTGCDTVVFLISFRIENSAGDAGYFQGLPDANSHAPLCAAEDDLAHEQDDPAEAMTAAGRYFVENGACPPAAPALRSEQAAKVVDHLVGQGATPAEREMPGTF